MPPPASGSGGHSVGFASLDVPVEERARAEAQRLLPELEHEMLEPDGEATAVLESAYARVGTIAGPALTDGAKASFLVLAARAVAVNRLPAAGYALRLQAIHLSSRRMSLTVDGCRCRSWGEIVVVDGKE